MEEKPSFLKVKLTKSEQPRQKTVAELFSSENSTEAILVQLPGTLPFERLEPHDGKGLLQLISQIGGRDSIGKIRVHKSGKVSMRLEANGRSIDFDLSSGIQANFY